MCYETIKRPHLQIQNYGYFADQPHEVKVQNELDLRLNLYRNVDKIKHKDKLIDQKEINKKIIEFERLYNRERIKIWQEKGLHGIDYPK